MHPAFWGKNSAYRGQLSQLWTMDTISWHQGALSLLTMDSRQSTIFFQISYFYTLFSLIFTTFKVILVRSIFSFVSLYHLKLLERVSN